MRTFALTTAASLALLSAPLLAQDEDEGGGSYDGGAQEVVVTGTRLNSLSGGSIAVKPPVIGFKRQADSAVRTIEIVSDSREEDMRKREVQAMLLAAIERAKAQGFSLVTGQFELTEVTRANWQDQFPGLAVKAGSDEDGDEIEDDDDYDDEDNAPPAAFEDDGSTTTIRLKVKTRLDGSIGNAEAKISRFIKAVPATGRSQIVQKGALALTIVKPEQYRDEIYRRVAEGAKHAVSFYGPDYAVQVTGLDGDIQWKQVSNTEVFLYIQYGFTIGK